MSSAGIGICLCSKEEKSVSILLAIKKSAMRSLIATSPYAPRVGGQCLAKHITEYERSRGATGLSPATGAGMASGEVEKQERRERTELRSL